MNDRHVDVDFWWLGIAIIAVALIVVSYLNGHDNRMLELARINACAHTSNPTACIAAVSKK